MPKILETGALAHPYIKEGGTTLISSRVSYVFYWVWIDLRLEQMYNSYHQVKTKVELELCIPRRPAPKKGSPSSAAALASACCCPWVTSTCSRSLSNAGQKCTTIYSPTKSTKTHNRFSSSACKGGISTTHRLSFIFLCRCEPAIEAASRYSAHQKLIGWIQYNLPTCIVTNCSHPQVTVSNHKLRNNSLSYFLERTRILMAARERRCLKFRIHFNLHVPSTSLTSESASNGTSIYKPTVHSFGRLKTSKSKKKPTVSSTRLLAQKHIANLIVGTCSARAPVSASVHIR